jgi:ribosomal protein S18 acetylase RimI-like enzyme
MDKPIHIAEIKSDQIAKYKEFITVGLLNDGENFRISPNDDINAPFPTQDRDDSFTLGSFVNNTLVGVVSFERDGGNREKLRHKGILFRMYVAPEFRGQGVAKTFIEELLIRIRKISDIEQVNLVVAAHNETAKNLYRNFGFVSFSSEKYAIKWQGKYFTEEQMVLTITMDRV